MTRSLLPLVLLLLMPSVVAAQATRDTEGEAEMLSRINALRVDASLPPLVRHAALDEAALVHSMDMAEHAMLAHLSPRTGDPAARVADAGVRATRIAQNIALRRSTGDALVSILESDAHRQQLLTPELTHVGLAAVHGARGMYVTQVVAELEGPSPLPPPAFHDLRGAAPGAETGAESDTASETDAYSESAAASETDVYSESDTASETDAYSESAAEPHVAAEPVIVPDSTRAPIEAPIDPRERGLAVSPPEASPYHDAYHEPAEDPPAPEYEEARPSAPSTSASVQAPTIRLPYGARQGVAGYWVYYGSRWWFFPNAGSAAPGSVLHADPSVQGPPAGYDDAGRPTSAAVAPPLPRRPAFGWSPRRHYPLWMRRY